MRELVLGVAMIFAVEPSSCRGGADGKDAPVKDGVDAPVKDGGVGAPVVKDAGGGKPDPCGAEALRLGSARVVAPWKIPAGCTPKGGQGNTIARSEEELKKVLECASGSGVDFGEQAVLAVGYSLSPAGAGMSAFDDGEVVTLVTRQRSPCPNDPLPMPMNTMAWFLLAGGGERTFAGTNCTIESTCK
jgi:hypothetical protein